MRKNIAASFLLCALAAWPQSVLAWGHEGHAIVADIAEAQLSPAARVQVMQLLSSEGKNHLSDIASWADEQKADGVKGYPSHSIRMPLTGDPGPPTACPSHVCVVAGIEKYAAILADRNASVDQREVALKLVVHLVGDVHQPLHCVEDTGSGIHVMFDGEDTTLHKVWDSGIIKEQQDKAKGMARSLLAGSGSVPTGGDAMAWALESRDIARDTIYSTVPLKANAAHPFTLPPDYGARNWPIVARRLTQAGDRLALLLNQALR